MFAAKHEWQLLLSYVKDEKNEVQKLLLCSDTRAVNKQTQEMVN